MLKYSTPPSLKRKLWITGGRCDNTQLNLPGINQWLDKRMDPEAGACRRAAKVPVDGIGRKMSEPEDSQFQPSLASGSIANSAAAFYSSVWQNVSITINCGPGRIGAQPSLSSETFRAFFRFHGRL